MKKTRGHVDHPRQLQEILDIVRELYDEKSNDTVESEMIQEKKSKLMQMKTVLEMHDFSGINRKVQLKKGVSSKASAETESEAEDGGNYLFVCLGLPNYQSSCHICRCRTPEALILNHF